MVNRSGAVVYRVWGNSIEPWKIPYYERYVTFTESVKVMVSRRSMKPTPRTTAKATRDANASGVYATAMTVRLFRRVSKTDYVALKQAQQDLAVLWDVAVNNPSVQNGPRTIGHVYSTVCKGKHSTTSGTNRRKLAEDIVAAFKSYDAASKSNANAKIPGPCVSKWRRLRWDLYGKTVKFDNKSLSLNLGKGCWITVDLSRDARWADIKDRCVQISVDRDVADHLVLRVTCIPDTPAALTEQQVRIVNHSAGKASLDPGVRAWTIVITDKHNNSRAHVIPIADLALLRSNKAKLNLSNRNAERIAKLNRRIVDAERKLARSVHDLLRDEGVVSLIVGITPCSGWARRSGLERLYAICAKDGIKLTLINEINSSRSCPKCSTKNVQNVVGGWHCSACGFARTHKYGRDVVAASNLQSLNNVPTKNLTFVHSTPFNAPVKLKASQPPREPALGLNTNTQKPGKDTQRYTKLYLGQRRSLGRYGKSNTYLESTSTLDLSRKVVSISNYSPMKTTMGNWLRTL
jgi:hypothetical protein